MPSDSDNPSSPFLERKLSTILSADVAEFSRLMSEDEEQTLRTFRGHKKVFEALVATHRGRVFNTAGDAILAEFSSAVEAVRCATDIQSALRTRNDKLPPERQVRFRIGINLGDVMIQGQDLLGDGVNVAARLQTAAEPGGVCISGSVHDQIRNKLSLTFQSLGEKTYKNIAQPIRTFSVVEMEGGVTLPSPKPPASSKMPMVAVGVAAGVVLLLCGSYWIYKQKTGNMQQTAQTAVLAPQPESNPAPQIQPKPEETPVSPATADPTPNHAAKDHSGAATPHKPVDPLRYPMAASAAAPSTKPVAPGAPSPASPAAPASAAGPFDGIFGGQVCFAETLHEQERCFHGQGLVVGNRITGKWPMGKDTGVTMYLDGDVSATGDLKMEMHSEKSDGSRIITADFTGSIHDRRIDATGNLRMGRPASLHWHKNPHAPVTPTDEPQ